MDKKIKKIIEEICREAMKEIDMEASIHHAIVFEEIKVIRKQ